MIARIFVVSALFLLGGCTHYSELTPSDFSRGTVPHTQFARDNYECRTKAVIRENMHQGGGDQIGLYNRAYAACMNQHGYASNDIDLLNIGG